MVERERGEREVAKNGALQNYQARLHAERTAVFQAWSEKGTVMARWHIKCVL